jgi:hypothetical protein
VTTGVTVCVQCNGPIGPGSREVTVRSTSDGQLACVHQDCLDRLQERGHRNSEPRELEGVVRSQRGCWYRIPLYYVMAEVLFSVSGYRSCSSGQ